MNVLRRHLTLLACLEKAAHLLISASSSGRIAAIISCERGYFLRYSWRKAVAAWRGLSTSERVASMREIENVKRSSLIEIR